ncbi:sensor histidine kinase [Streptomyces sp. NPDC091268]|uniref:sensor histidine kinase n=1 Tax=Streptomyces sp. NPDC091268 TaxID=3365979 RepID=UPI00381FAA3E
MGESWTITLICALAAAVGAAGWLGVATLRARRRHRKAIEERGWLLERERESAARAAVDAERARIAAELHDIVSHNVSVMVVQAGAAREVLATLPDQAAAAMSAVETAGRNTMTELRHLLGLLAPAQDGQDGQDEPDAPDRSPHRSPDGNRHGDLGSGLDVGLDLSPQPTLSRLGPLIDRIAFAGLPVEMRISGEPRPLPAGIDVTAYRIIQEGLTNALKHGDGAKAEVTVRYADHYLRVEVLNSGPSVLSDHAPAGPGGGPVRQQARTRADGTGRGLLGLRERVAVYGGDLDARRRLGGGYRVRARIPLDRP